MTTITLDHPPFPYLAELIYCLSEGYPAPLTAALLELRYDPDLLTEAHDTWLAEWGTYRNVAFLEAVLAVTGVDCCFCTDCGVPVWTEETTVIGDGQVCDAKCLDEYYCCDDCGRMVDGDAINSVAGDETVCDRCLSRSYTRCERCDTYVRDDQITSGYCENCRDNYMSFCDTCDEYYVAGDDDHDHDNGCDCEAPHRCFLFPADGHGEISENERFTVELPKGTIDDEGLNRIRQLLFNDETLYAQMSNTSVIREVVESIGPLWQAKRGNFTRRLSSAFYSQHGVKLAPGVISEVGNVARAHSSGEATWRIEVTRDLNDSAEAFYHEDSCWWQSYYRSRCCLKQWGGLGLRTYVDDVMSSRRPSGRAWVQPLNDDLEPTHDARGAHAYVVYNGYGELSGYVAARIVAHLASLSYRKIEFTTPGDYRYVNGDMGYLVADEATCAETQSLRFAYDQHDNHDAYDYMREAA